MPRPGVTVNSFLFPVFNASKRLLQGYCNNGVGVVVGDIQYQPRSRSDSSEPDRSGRREMPGDDGRTI